VGKVDGGITGHWNLRSLQLDKQHALWKMAYSTEECVFRNCKMKSFQLFREQGMWTQYFSSRMVGTHIHQMSSCTSCMMCLVTVSCQIDF